MSAAGNPYQTQSNTNGGRKWIYPLIRKGPYYNYRSWLSYVYLLLFFTAPFLRINGQPVLLLNVIERRFVILGQVFWPQDFFLFVLAMLAGVVCVILFTIAFGRIFCGWICPQTIFMEMVFRKVEELIEGDARKRKKLDEGNWTFEKKWKKALKHTAFLLISFLIANTFLAYIIGSEQLVSIITQPVNRHMVGFISIWVFTAIFYLVYSQVRELVCTVICPYGRLQGVLTDKHTLMVAYDYLRGEPRGKLHKGEAQPKGDCVDCRLCVDVCPTAIDIREGTQVDCINCTACIDVCNEVMIKISKPVNLIGFYSEEQIKEGKKPRFTARMAAYSGIIILLLGVLTFFVMRRSDVDVTVMRSAGLLYQQQPGGYISNLYNADMINKTDKDQHIELRADDERIKIKYVQTPDVLDSAASVKAVFFIWIPAEDIKEPKTQVTLNVMQGDKVIDRIKTTFVGPIYGN
ncbi:cytochrome c oxidase accessory protein CcoG [Mucilaginibacter calamicampi]|uniref:Cytochrome c oxidase accessory protein CcoG n=1 Tax=Mucilaginibacter calamicampi TaxID=1302352 RepID=A0ABW2YX26_9SPHI